MGELIDRIGLRMLVDGDGLVDNFKNNSLFFYEKYQGSDANVTAIDITNITPGYFYHFHYLDDSNWMRYSPVFVTNFKKMSNQIIIFGINLNFIPLEARAYFFDKFMSKTNFDNNKSLTVDYEGAYTELIRFGFEYALVEYNVAQIKLVHRISMDFVPRFLIAAHPANKYDPEKLFQIWQAKLSSRDTRNNEIMNSMLNDFYDIKGMIDEKYVVLKNHIERLQTHMKKYSSK